MHGKNSLLPFIHAEVGVNSETLLMLTSMGSVEQYKACGLLTVKDQLRLRKLIGKQCQSPSQEQSSASDQSSASSTTHATPSRGKLSKKFLQDLTPEDKRVYLMM